MYKWNCCRICLGTESLNPIFSITSQSEKYTQVLLKTTGIKIESNDLYPKEMCTECINFINLSTRFRHKAEMAQKTLSERLNNQPFNIKTETMQIFKTDEIKISSIDISEYTEPIDSYNYELNKDIHIDKLETSDDNTENLIEFVSEIQDLPGKTIEFNFDAKKPSKRAKNTKINKTKKPVRKRITRCKKQNLENDQPCNDITTNNGESGKEAELQDKEARVKETNTQDKKTRVKEMIECKYCDKILTSKLSLRNHYKIHTGFDVVCEHCGKKFITRRLLLMHCRAKHGYEKTDKCSYCDYTASNAEQVKIHERLHTGEKPYACAECGAGFHRKSSYLQHVAIHLPEKTVQCVQCPALFKSVTLMRIHLSRHKQPQYRYKCRVCAGAFARRRNVLRHLQRIHALAGADKHVERVKIV